MLVYRFDSSVPTPFEHRLMAKLDNWFFLGGNRLRIFALEGNSYLTIQETMCISKVKKILKLFSYLFFPIVLIALLVRYLLHARFERNWRCTSLSDFRFFPDIQLFDNPERLNIWKNGKNITGIDVCSISLSDLKTWFPLFNKTPETSRFKNYVKDGQFSEEEESKKSYFRGMLRHVIECMLSLSDTRWDNLMKLLPKMAIVFKNKSCFGYRDFHEHWKDLARHTLGEGGMANIIDKTQIYVERQECEISKIILKAYFEKHLHVIRGGDFIELIINEATREFRCPNVINAEVCNAVDNKCQEHLVKAVIKEVNSRFPSFNNSSFSIFKNTVLFYTIFPLK
ncbi:DUF648 domain-containing protein [Candidatus Chlamydia corallus]|uniref:DUF648 domain-containing protein n=1 Tax=Candidatus Chlamydia corallus TaxID=2038470 RepID=UPI001EFE21EE|nr:DUF648 domain-containing protein [Candidatus Chlamydia corallus]